VIPSLVTMLSKLSLPSGTVAISDLVPRIPLRVY